MNSTASREQEPLGRRLVHAQFSHPVEHVQLLETHISWVVLTGHWAYKVKKPVKFDFLDYSTRQQRLFFCQREIERNRIWAGDLYVDVVAIVQDQSGLTVQPLDEPIRGAGLIIDYAVRMKQFPQTALLGHQLAKGLVTSRDMEQLADDLAETHARTAPIVRSPDAAQQAAIQPALDNFQFLLGQLANDEQRRRVERINAWTRAQLVANQSRWADRSAAGRVRQCHGDLHLNNLLVLDGRFVPFDGIEFNDDLSQIDVINDLAFLAMELSEHGYRAHAYRLRNRYFERTEDYDGLRLLPFYLVYRAMVRAKVDLIRQVQTRGGEKAELSPGGEKYLDYAQAVIDRPAPELWITCGPSGSGKSTRAMEHVERQGLFRLRADVVRKHLAGRDPLDQTPRSELATMYGPEMTARTYRRLGELAAIVIAAGYRPIVDATFLKLAQRRQFAELADSLGVPFRIVACEAAPQELERRLAGRGRDPSEATAEVLRAQLQSHEPLRPAERQYIVE